MSSIFSPLSPRVARPSRQTLRGRTSPGYCKEAEKKLDVVIKVRLPGEASFLQKVHARSDALGPPFPHASKVPPSTLEFLAGASAVRLGLFLFFCKDKGYKDRITGCSLISHCKGENGGTTRPVRAGPWGAGLQRPGYFQALARQLTSSAARTCRPGDLKGHTRPVSQDEEPAFITPQVFHVRAVGRHGACAFWRQCARVV